MRCRQNGAFSLAALTCHWRDSLPLSSGQQKNSFHYHAAVKRFHEIHSTFLPDPVSVLFSAEKKEIRHSSSASLRGKLRNKTSLFPKTMFAPKRQVDFKSSLLSEHETAGLFTDSTPYKITGNLERSIREVQ